jgi:hypothetical protein
VPPVIEREVQRFLEKEPADRYHDVTSLARALGACADADGWSAERAEAWWLANQPIAAAVESASAWAAELRSGEAILDTLNHVDFGAIADPGPGLPLDPELTIAEDRAPSSRGSRDGVGPP